MKWFESFGLDAANECLWRDGAQIALPPKPFSVLSYLVDHPGRLIPHDELLDALWPETYVQPQVLRTYVLELRKVLGDDAKQPRFIQTLPKRGFRFVAEVKEAVVNGKPHATSEPQEPATNGLIGREAELAKLNELVQWIEKGHRQVVFVTGEAGIGKTALVDAFCGDLASTPGVIVARGQCVEGLGLKDEYYPVKEALGQLCASADAERACEALARLAPGWLAALGRQPVAVANGAQPSAVKAMRSGDLCAALEELTRERPLILVVEDLHWADGSTLELISALARRRTAAKLMVLATSRVKDVSVCRALKEIKSDLLVRRLCEEVALLPLPKAEVRKLLSRELQQDVLPAGLAEFVFQRSEGNPLFVIAILEHLVAQAFIRREQNGTAQWELNARFAEIDTDVPHQLAQMIELEIGRLTDKEQQLLEAASLVPVAFPAWAVAAALEENAAETEEACDQLARRLYFVHRAGQDELPDGARSTFYSFAHELFRDVLYQRQAEARRAQRHIRIAERLGDLFVGREAFVAREMAMHFEAAGCWERASDSLRAAARHATERGAGSEAEELFEQALRLAGQTNAPTRSAAVDSIRAEMARVSDGL